MKYYNFKILFFTIASLFVFTACNNDEELEKKTANQSKSELLNTVFAVKRTKSDIETRAASLNVAVWDAGQTINIKFIFNAGGTDYAKQKVEEYANEWTKYANINFNFVPTTEEADIKIAFNYKNNRVAWSNIGKKATEITNNSGKPSMSIPFYNNSDVDSKEFRTVVLRLFGHVLGLIYENQGANEEGLYDWNRDKVFTYFKQEGWSNEEIESLIEIPYAKRRTKFTEFDEKSIMLLYFPEFLINDGKPGTWNTELSDMDIEYIKTLYPGR